jgi:hypothetical protein
MTASSSRVTAPTEPPARPRTRRTRERPARALRATPLLGQPTTAQFWRTSVRCPACGQQESAVALWAARSLGTHLYTVQLGCKHELARDDFLALLSRTLFAERL